MSFVLAAVAAGTAMKVGGGILSRNEQLDNAKAEAAARNAVLASNIQKQEGFFNDNKGVWDANIGKYAPAAQGQQLQTAQDTRGNANVGNITNVDTNNVPTQADASPAVKSELAKRMLAVYQGATDRAKNMGKLGGYSDTWLQNQLGNRQADRDIGVTNSYAEGRKALLGPEQDAAAAAAYKPPSIWGPLLSGGGSILASAGGGGAFGGASGGLTGFSPDAGMYFGNGTQASMGGGAGGGVWG